MGWRVRGGGERAAAARWLIALEFIPTDEPSRPERSRRERGALTGFAEGANPCAQEGSKLGAVIPRRPLPPETGWGQAVCCCTTRLARGGEAPRCIPLHRQTRLPVPRCDKLIRRTFMLPAATCEAPPSGGANLPSGSSTKRTRRTGLRSGTPSRRARWVAGRGELSSVRSSERQPGEGPEPRPDRRL